MFKLLEIQGFKSFVQKTALEFPKGITAIVGPNGSGKSNLVDAIRWVLGEQSMKNLRSEKSDDVIFAGTPAKPPTSVAAVSLHFDNESRMFDVPYPEVVIGRKVYRDGTSEYTVNRSPARLKDITQLLAGAKLGLRGLSIINQGSHDVFLRASGKERREMLEEMLGLKEFRLKKEEAERKMEETKANVAEAARLLEELEPHLRSLKRQASRWERRQEKEEALKKLEENFFLRKIAQLAEISPDAGTEAEDIEKELIMLRNEITAMEEEIRSWEEKLPATIQESHGLRDTIRACEAKRGEILRSIGKIEGELAALSRIASKKNISEQTLLHALETVKERITYTLAYEDLPQIKEELRSVLTSLEQLLKTPGAERDFEKPLLENRDKLAAELENTESGIREASRKLSELARLQDESSRDLRAKLEALEGKKNQLRDKENLLREYQFEEEKRKLREEDLRAKMKETGLGFDSFKATPHQPDPELQELPFEELEARMFRLRRDLADIGLVDEEILREYEEALKRVEFIKTQKEDLEKALADLRDLSFKLEHTIRHDFDEGLREISDACNHYFKLIFGGGSAKIYQIKPPRVEAGGGENSENGAAAAGLREEAMPEIEISVSIPRKKIKGIEMLSGGERALTSIAVLFAIVGSSAPPFLILDEVDAPLDESNSERFAKLLRELSEKTQFVVITHNRATMEAAEILYGIAMEDGVSRIFSLRFEEAQKVAEADVHPALE